MIHVVYTNISTLSRSDYNVLYKNASPERRSRADRYLRWEDSLRCVAADALLRYALGTNHYTVEKGLNGKPFIREKESFHYNLSHAGSWVVIAYGDSEVGVDVEQFRSNAKMEAIARRFFTPEEQKYVFAELESPQAHFFEIWTGKESYVKYLGTGLQMDLRSFSVLSPDPNVCLHHRILPGGYSLTLCAADNNCLFTQLDVQQLL